MQSAWHTGTKPVWLRVCTSSKNALLTLKHTWSHDFALDLGIQHQQLYQCVHWSQTATKRFLESEPGVEMQQVTAVQRPGNLHVSNFTYKLQIASKRSPSVAQLSPISWREEESTRSRRKVRSPWEIHHQPYNQISSIAMLYLLCCSTRDTGHDALCACRHITCIHLALIYQWLATTCDHDTTKIPWTRC